MMKRPRSRAAIIVPKRPKAPNKWNKLTTMFFPGTITNVSPPQVTIDGATTPVNVILPGGYTPVVNDRVFCFRFGSRLFVLWNNGSGGGGGGLWVPTGTIIFPVPLVNQTSDGNSLPATSSTSPIYQHGTHDVTLAHVGGFLEVTYQASGDECFYEITEQLIFESTGAAAGDVYGVNTYSGIGASYWSSGSAGFAYAFVAGAAGHVRTQWTDERSGWFYLPGGGAYTPSVAGGWSVDCNNSAARSVTSPGCWIMATRYVLV